MFISEKTERTIKNEQSRDIGLMGTQDTGRINIREN
jgi:hypothetical protein